jgi:phytanoyl-CoA hydroxylase
MQTLKSQFDRDGYVVISKLLSTGDFGELVDKLDRYIHDVVPGLPDSDAFYVDRARPETLKQLQHMEGDAFFRDYGKHPTWRKLAQSLLGEDVEAMSVEWFNKPPGTGSPTPPHQDNYYFCLKPPKVVTIWLAIDPVDEENGCLHYVVGSHVRGIRPHCRSSILGFSQGVADYGPADEENEVAVRLEPNDAVAHHGKTIHRADPNGSAFRNRRAFAMVLRGVSTHRDEDAFGRYLAALKTQHQGLGLMT